MFNIEKTQEELLKDHAIGISELRDTHINTVKMQYQQSFDLVWNSMYAPQAVFDMYGNEAVQLFVEANKTIGYILQLDSSYSPPMPKYEYTLNEDGTVTVGDLIVTPINVD